MNIKNFIKLWSEKGTDNQDFKNAYDNIHKALLSNPDFKVKRLFPGCNLEYYEKSIHVGFLGLNQSLSLSNYKKLQSLLQNTKNECQHLRWIKNGEVEQDQKIDFTSDDSQKELEKLYKRYEWKGGLETLNKKKTEQLEAEQRAFIGEYNIKPCDGSETQPSPIAYFKTLHEIVQWSTALHEPPQPLNIGHFDMFPVRVTKSDELEQLFDQEPTFWKECIRSTMNEIQQTMHPSGVLIVSNALLIRTYFTFDNIERQISGSISKYKKIDEDTEGENMLPPIKLQWCKDTHALRLNLNNTLGPYVLLMRNPGSGFANTTKFQVANELGRLLTLNNTKNS